jgi:hypothetical protein
MTEETPPPPPVAALPVHALAPKISVKSGTVKAGTVVRLETRTHYATIYYTVDGWAPTTASRRYEGPITIQENTVLQAIAIAPNFLPSLISGAKYTVPGTKVSAPPTLASDGFLYSGTPLQLVTAGSVRSGSAKVGDPLALQLNQDVVIDGIVAIPKGTPVEAVITLADRAGVVGEPGDLAFEVRSINLNGRKILLAGGETVEGRSHYVSGAILFPIPVFGAQAEIKPGMELTAVVTDEVRLTP